MNHVWQCMFVGAIVDVSLLFIDNKNVNNKNQISKTLFRKFKLKNWTKLS